MNIHFRLDDGHEAGRENLRRHLELLVDDGLDAGGIGLLDDGAHFGSEDALGVGLIEQGANSGMGFINWTPSFSSARPLSTFRNGTTRFTVPEIVRGRLSLDVPVHRALEQDRAENSVAIKAGAGDDARAHLVDERKHLLVVGPCAFLDSVSRSALGVLPPLWSSAAKKPG